MTAPKPDILISMFASSIAYAVICSLLLPSATVVSHRIDRSVAEIAPESVVRIAKRKKRKRRRTKKRNRKKESQKDASQKAQSTPKSAANTSSKEPGKEATPAAGPAAESTAADPAQVLEQAQAAEQDLDYEKVLQLSEQVQTMETATPDQINAALVLQATSLIVNGRQIDAEIPFTKLMRNDISYELPESTPPKIMAVFRKVQVEEQQAFEARKAAERKAIVEKLSLGGGPSDDAAGGKPLMFSFKVGDPEGSVNQVNVMYRRQGEPAFSALALARDAEQNETWLGEIPGEWTSSEVDFTVEYYVQTLDNKEEPLLTSGQVNAPREIRLNAGVFEVPVPFYRTTWFWSATAATVVITGIAGFIAYREAVELPDSDLDSIELQ